MANEPKKLVVRGWAFPDTPLPTPRGQDVTRNRMKAIAFLCAVRRLVGLNSRPAYYAICVAEAWLRNQVREEQQANPSWQELLQSESRSLGQLFEPERAGSGSSTGTPWTYGSTLSSPSSPSEKKNPRSGSPCAAPATR